MTEKANAIVELSNDQIGNIAVRICSNTGAIFQGIFPVNRTTFAHVKYLAVECFSKKTRPDEIENYKLISIGSKKTIDEQKTLREEKVQDGDEYFLAKKLSNKSRKMEQTKETSPIDEELIQRRTKDLPSPSNLPHQTPPSTRRTEFRTDLNRILLTLIETSHRLLWYRSDAEEIFEQVKRILSKSSISSEEVEINLSQVNQLIDIGFTDKQARFALKRTKSDFNAAIELLLTEPEIDNHSESERPNARSTYSHPTSFMSFQQFRQKYFQSNPVAIQALEDMGFARDEIITALQICHNDRNLACDYLVGDKRQQKILTETENEHGFGSDSNLFKTLMDNPIIQRAVNNPKTFFIILHLYENPNLVVFYINEPEIGSLLVQLSRIYHTEQHQSDCNASNNHPQESNTSPIVDNENED